MSRPAVREVVLVALLLVLAGWWGARYVRQFRDAGRPQLFYQQYFEPALMIACGAGFTSATRLPAAVDDFLEQRTDRFDCAQLPAELELKPASTVHQYAWFYLMWMVGLFWMAAGVSWSGLLPLFGALFALVIGLAYLIFRLAVPPGVAVTAAAGLSLSMLHVPNLPHLRDYAKAPFVLALFLMLAWMVKHPPPVRRLLGWCAAYGVVLGIGYGFRSDLIANVPPLVATVLLFLPGFHPRELAAKLGALVVAAAVFTVVAWPVITYVSRMGGCQWHAAVLGLDNDYDHTLGVTPSYYQWITHYSDEYLVTTVNSAVQRTGGGGALAHCGPGYDAASGAYLLQVASSFPADVLTRAQASILRVMDLPFNLWAERDPQIRRGALGELLTSLAGTSRLALAVAILALGAINLRWGLFAVSAIVYFGSYPSMQFAARHFFHLEFLGWWGMAFVGWQAARLAIARARRQELPWPLPPSRLAIRALAFGGAVLAIALAPVPVVRGYHDRSVAALTETLLAAERTPVSTVPAAAGLDVRFAGVPDERAADPTETAYLDVRFDLAACPGGVTVGLQYDSSDPFGNFSSIIEPQPPGVIAERLLVPVYRGFQGLTLGDASPACVRSVERLQSVKGLPLLPTLTLPANWRDLPRHQQLGAGAIRLWNFGD